MSLLKPRSQQFQRESWETFEVHISRYISTKIAVTISQNEVASPNLPLNIFMHHLILILSSPYPPTKYGMIVFTGVQALG